VSRNERTERKGTEDRMTGWNVPAGLSCRGTCLRRHNAKEPPERMFRHLILLILSSCPSCLSSFWRAMFRPCVLPVPLRLASFALHAPNAERQWRPREWDRGMRDEMGNS